MICHLTVPCASFHIEKRGHHNKNYGEDKDFSWGQFQIDYPFNVVDQKGVAVCERRDMSFPEPDFKMCEGAIPSEYLYDDCKAEAGDMEVLHGTDLPPDKYAKDQEHDPQEVDKDSEVCCEFM
jgi:hypothetical protein